VSSVTLAPAGRSLHRSTDAASRETFTGLSHGPRLGIGRLALLALGVVLGAFENNYWLFILQMSFIMGMVALGTLIVAGYAREITLMQAGLTGTAIYVSGWAYRSNTGGLDWPFPAAVAFGTAVVVAISIAVAVVSARLSPIYVMVLTLAVQFTIENSVFTVGKLTGGLQAPMVPRPNFYGLSLRNEHGEYFYLMGLSIVLIVLVERFRHCRYGRAMLIVGNDKNAAAAVGINPWVYRVSAFALGGVFAGVGGAFWAPQLGAPPGIMQFFAMQSLFFLAIPVFAGFDSVPAVFITGMFFMALPMSLEQYHFQPLLLGGVALMAGVFLGPRGISGFTDDLVHKSRRIWATDGPRGLLRMLARPRKPNWLRPPDRRAARAYKALRAEELTLDFWSAKRAEGAAEAAEGAAEAAEKVAVR
jgi:branched-chain amino acid transport system permease protein